MFRNFGDETITKSSHLEKLGLLSGGVGRDHLSDFTTNLIKGYLLKYTEDFATRYLQPTQLRRVHVERVSFNYATRRWQSGHYTLPWHDGDYVILTPCDILTRDEAWINQSDMLSQFFQLRKDRPIQTGRGRSNSCRQPGAFRNESGCPRSGHRRW